LIYDASTRVSEELFKLYEDTDLRKKLFFEQSNAGVKFKGFYHGKRSCFAGLAQDEMYLIKAECSVRRDAKAEAESYLNTFLSTRYEKNKFSKLSFETAESALDRILLERRKQLVFRGIRWMDLRRLNRYPDRAVVVEKRFDDVDGSKVYKLLPNDLRYTFLIPILAIDAGGYTQNPR